MNYAYYIYLNFAYWITFLFELNMFRLEDAVSYFNHVKFK